MPRNKTMINNVIKLLEQNNKSNPEAIALKDEFQSLTYKEYRNEAGKIGTYIAKTFPGNTNKPIAVLIDRNVKSVLAFMGIVYSANFYVPIDTSMPEERIKLIYNTLDPLTVIDAREAGDNFTDTVKVDEILSSTEADETLIERAIHSVIDRDPLYAIFTSGSTGIPKGVCVSHGSVLDLIDAFEDAFSFDRGTVFGNQAPFDFDVSVKDIYNALKCGGCVNIIPKRFFTAPAMLVKHLYEEKIDTIIWAVSAMRIVADFDTFNGMESLPVLKNVFFSGEVMPVKSLNYWRTFFPKTRFVNLYGPTEITCNCTYYEIKKDFAPDERFPIGKPFENTRMFLLDNDGKTVDKSGVQGEICVEGRCLALGYYNNEEKTNAGFTPHPFVSEYPLRIYRTGDLGYYDDNGDLVFASRKDHQIKHMGHRIELGEIENALNSIPFLTIAVCIYDEKNEKIVCFYQAAEDRKKDIVMELSKKLSKYMWPNKYVRYDVLPLNKNGKIDRVLLKKQWEEENE